MWGNIETDSISNPARGFCDYHKVRSRLFSLLVAGSDSTKWDCEWLMIIERRSPEVTILATP
jgi:hypothetical protein